MRYPNGQSYQPDAGKPQKAAQKLKAVSFAKRGMRLEEMINRSNEWYLHKNIAVIHKKPTPIQVVKVNYPKRSQAVITEAYYRQASTTDYNGVYQGKYIDFEAKQTNLVTGFPLRNMHEHQIDHMASCESQGGVSFILILFGKTQSAYLYPFSSLYKNWSTYKNGGASKIGLDTIQADGYQIPFGFQPELDYLQALDEYLASK